MEFLFFLHQLNAGLALSSRDLKQLDLLVQLSHAHTVFALLVTL